MHPLFSGIEPPLVNIGCGTDLSIRELAALVKETVSFAGDFAFDTSKPDGSPRKLLEVGRINRLGWKAQTSLQNGLALAYADYLAGISAK